MINSLFPMFFDVGRILILGTIGFAIFQVVQAQRSAESVVASCVLAALTLSFFKNYLLGLQNLSKLCFEMIENTKTYDGSIFKYLGEVIVKSGTVYKDETNWMEWAPKGFVNSGATLIKAGIWGALNSIIQFLFLLSSKFIIASQAVLMELALVLSPIVAAFTAISTSALKNLLKFTLQVSLWGPILALVELIVTFVSKKSIMQRSLESTQFDFGLDVISIQLVAIILTFSIPSISQKLVSFTLESDLGGGPANIYSFAKSKTLAGVSFARSQFQKLGIVIITIGASLSVSMSAQAQVPAPDLIFFGYVTKVDCRGKLIASSVGNSDLVEAQALPSELGCGLILKPKEPSGTTNLVLETSVDSVVRTLEIRNERPQPKDLKIRMREE